MSELQSKCHLTVTKGVDSRAALHFRLTPLTIALLLLALLAGPPRMAWADQEPLPAMDADLSQTSVSGISSGGFMTAQLSTAYSASIVGAGIIAGGPFYCAGSLEGVSFLENATTTCMVPLGPTNAPDAARAFAEAKTLAASGAIDDVANLKRQRIYIFSGSADTTVTTLVVDQTDRYYELAGTPQNQIRYVKNIDAGHSIVTNDPKDTACAVTAPPYINDCGFEQSQQILRFIYGKLNPPAEPSKLSGRIVEIDQKAFVKHARTGMADTAYAYIPKACESEQCRVHVALHGCEQYAGKIGDNYYTGTGYNEIADTNKIIVLYPQTTTSDSNPKGCWDFWGYSGEDPNHPAGATAFYTKGAPQMSAIMAMVKHLGAPRQTLH
jgi:poly(3-hydroxybutyrate) depolymerase